MWTESLCVDISSLTESIVKAVCISTRTSEQVAWCDSGPKSTSEHGINEIHTYTKFGVIECFWEEQMQRLFNRVLSLTNSKVASVENGPDTEAAKSTVKTENINKMQNTHFPSIYGVAWFLSITNN